jgi:hypothetical protein
MVVKWFFDGTFGGVDTANNASIHIDQYRNAALHRSFHVHTSSHTPAVRFSGERTLLGHSGSVSEDFDADTDDYHITVRNNAAVHPLTIHLGQVELEFVPCP